MLMQIGAYGGHLRFGLSSVPHEAHYTTAMWGSRNELADVIAFAQRGELQWAVEPVPLDDVNHALERVRNGQVAGRLVLVP